MNKKKLAIIIAVAVVVVAVVVIAVLCGTGVIGGGNVGSIISGSSTAVGTFAN